MHPAEQSAKEPLLTSVHSSSKNISERNHSPMDEMDFDRLVCAYDRLHKDYVYLEGKHQALLTQNEALSCAVREKDMLIWRMQIENERCRAKLSRLLNASALK